MNTICKIKDIYKALYLFEKEFQKKNEITINEAMVLCCLNKDKTKYANEICSFVGLSSSRVSRIITSVEEKGYIIREMGSDDKRQMNFELSEKGIKKVAEMDENEITIEDFLKKVNLEV